MKRQFIILLNRKKKNINKTVCNIAIDYVKINFQEQTLYLVKERRLR